MRPRETEKDEPLPLSTPDCPTCNRQKTTALIWGHRTVTYWSSVQAAFTAYLRRSAPRLRHLEQERGGRPRCPTLEVGQARGHYVKALTKRCSPFPQVDKTKNTKAEISRAQVGKRHRPAAFILTQPDLGGLRRTRARPATGGGSRPV